MSLSISFFLIWIESIKFVKTGNVSTPFSNGKLLINFILVSTLGLKFGFGWIFLNKIRINKFIYSFPINKLLLPNNEYIYSK